MMLQLQKYLFETNAEDMKNLVQENDVFVVDRGFRDAKKFLKNMNLKVDMPFYIDKGMKQHPTEEANASQLTKLRWMVGSEWPYQAMAFFFR